jgi:hypothetical protein
MPEATILYNESKHNISLLFWLVGKANKLGGRRTPFCQRFPKERKTLHLRKGISFAQFHTYKMCICNSRTEEISTLQAWFPGWVSQKYYFPSWFGVRFHKMGKTISYVTYITMLIIKDKQTLTSVSTMARILKLPWWQLHRVWEGQARTTFCCSIWYGNLKLEL